MPAFAGELNAAIQVAREESQGGRRTVYTDGPLIHNRQMMDALGKDDIQEVGDYQSKKEIDVKESDEKESVVVVELMGYPRNEEIILRGSVSHFVMGHVQMWESLPGKSNLMLKKDIKS